MNNKAESQSLKSNENKLSNFICLASIFTGIISSIVVLYPPILLSLPDPIIIFFESTLNLFDFSFPFNQTMIEASLIIGIIGALINLYFIIRFGSSIPKKFIIGLVVNGFTILAFYIIIEFGKTICCQPEPITF